jgi:DNA-binding transcriptional MerR regulator
MHNRQKLYIRDVERKLGVKRKTLFYWEAHNKIPKAKREVMSGYRYWTLNDIERIKNIMRGE